MLHNYVSGQQAKEHVSRTKELKLNRKQQAGPPVLNIVLEHNPLMAQPTEILEVTERHACDSSPPRRQESRAIRLQAENVLDCPIRNPD